jgi:hypothetical protein
MGRRGRPPQGPRLVENVEGSDAAKERLRVILETLAGTLSVEHACALLGVGEARFHEMRSEVLRQAVSLLEPKPKGRRPEPPPSEDAQDIERLRQQVDKLRTDLRASQVREKIALVAPQLLQPAPEDSAKKKSPPSATNSQGGTNSTPSSSTPSGGTST